jgi:putative ABC transport system permease protein
MTWWQRLWWRRQLEEHLDKELRFHLDQHANDLISRGHDPKDARLQARLALGGPDQIKESCRDTHGIRWLEDLLKDVRYSYRVLVQSPSFTVTAVAAIALGIGANTAIFSVVNTVLLKPLPYPDADRIVQLEDTYSGVGSQTVGPKSLNLWRQQTTVFQDISAHWLDHMNLTSGSNKELLPAAVVTSGFFRLYGAPVLHGRTFTSDEDRPGAGHVVVLGYDIWTQRFAADPGIIDKTISLSDVPYVVVGILGPFDVEQFDQPPDVWVPFQIKPDINEKDSRLCFVTARLKPGVTIETAKAELQLADEAYRRAFPGIMRPKDGSTVLPLRDAMVGDIRLPLLVLAGAVAFVLLIACANVANLLLVRATGRRREIAIRAAMGAGRGRIIRQLLTESVALSLVGGALGLALGTAGIRAFLTLYPRTPLGPSPVNPINIPRIGEAGAAVTLDWRVLVFTVLVTVLTGVLFGVLPALQVSRADLNAPLKESGGRSGAGFGQTKTLSLLVISEITLAVILLIGGGLLIRTSIALRAVNPGFDSHSVLTMQMSLAGARFGQGSGADQLVRDSIRRIEALPGVESAASSCCLPLESVWQLPYIVAGRPLNGRFHGFAGWTFVSPGYFEVLRIPLLRGRTFTDQDKAAAPGAIIINETMARVGWPNSDPLNDRLLIGRTMGPEYEKDPVRQIVGIVGDVRDLSLNLKPRPAMYVPIAQVPDTVKALEFPLLPMAWMIRTHGKPQLLSSAISNELRLASGGLPVARMRSMEEVVAQSATRAQLNMVLMTVFGCEALLLAAIGIYGLMAYSVQQRMQEIGIRLALGAQPEDVKRMVFFKGMRLALIGIAIGIPVAFGLARVIASLLFGVTARDPLVFATVPAFLSATAVVAVWLPARRAGRIDPIEALRYQ